MNEPYRKIKNVVIKREGENGFLFAKIDHVGYLEKLVGKINLRTKMVKGRCSLPKVGVPFLLFSKPLEVSDHSDHRQITTSLVESVENLNNNVIQFKTENSTYRLTLFTQL